MRASGSFVYGWGGSGRFEIAIQRRSEFVDHLDLFQTLRVIPMLMPIVIDARALALRGHSER